MNCQIYLIPFYIVFFIFIVIKPIQEILVDNIPIENIVSYSDLQLLNVHPQLLQNLIPPQYQGVPNGQRDGS